jgi:hypothetical protein
MDTLTVYCSACDKDVHVTRTPAPLHSGEANLEEEQLVCLAYGPRCPLDKCPVANLPSVVMGVRLARNGLHPEHGWRTMRMRCDGCETEAELEVLDDLYAYCTICGTTTQWAVQH